MGELLVIKCMVNDGSHLDLEIYVLRNISNLSSSFLNLERAPPPPSEKKVGEIQTTVDKSKKDQPYGSIKLFYHSLLKRKNSKASFRDSCIVLV